MTGTAPATGGRGRRACHPGTGESHARARSGGRGPDPRLWRRRRRRDRADARRTRPRTATAAATAAPAPPTAQAARPGLRLKRIGTFSSPVFLTAPPGDRSRLFVVEQGGRVVIVRDGKQAGAAVPGRLPQHLGRRGAGPAVARVRARLRPERRCSTSTTRRATASMRIVEYQRASANRADARLGADRALPAAPGAQPQRRPDPFGPDGLLYAGLGDGGGGGDQHGSRGNGQNLGSLLGKILRIDPRADGRRAYRVPSSNPFVRPQRRARARSTPTGCATRGAGRSIRAATTS